jgi:sugar lactone lactonase YvrE
VDVAEAPDGTIWVTEGGADDFAIFSKDGTFLERWGKLGTANGQFDFSIPGDENPSGAIVWLKDGSFWVDDAGNYRIQKFDASRHWVATVGGFGTGDGQFTGRTNLAVGPDDRLYVQDDGGSTRIQVFDGDGRFLGRFGNGAASTMGYHVPPVVVGKRLFEAEGTSDPWQVIHVFDTDGTYLKDISGHAMTNVQGGAVGPNGLLYFADWDGKIHVVDPNTMTLLSSWKVGPGWPASTVQGLGATSDGRVIAAEWKFAKVEIFDVPASAGTTSSAEPTASGPATLQPVAQLEAPGGLSVPVDVAQAPDGTIWVTEGGSSDFAVFAEDGTFIERWGKLGTAKGEFDFSTPEGASDPSGPVAFLPDGSFWVGDPGNYRIQYFDKNRNWRRTIGSFGTGDGQFLGQTTLAVSGDGTLFVEDWARRDVQVFDRNGDYVRILGKTDTGNVLDNPGYPGIAGNYVFIGDGSSDKTTVMKVLGTDGSYVTTISSPAFDNLADANLGPDGLVYVADWVGRIHVIDPETMTVLSSWNVGPGYPASTVEGLGVMSDGRVIAAEWRFGRAEIFRIPAAP